LNIENKLTYKHNHKK